MTGSISSSSLQLKCIQLTPEQGKEDCVVCRGPLWDADSNGASLVGRVVVGHSGEHPHAVHGTCLARFLLALETARLGPLTRCMTCQEKINNANEFLPMNMNAEALGSLELSLLDETICVAAAGNPDRISWLIGVLSEGLVLSPECRVKAMILVARNPRQEVSLDQRNALIERLIRNPKDQASGLTLEESNLAFQLRSRSLHLLLHCVSINTDRLDSILTRVLIEEDWATLELFFSVILYTVPAQFSSVSPEIQFGLVLLSMIISERHPDDPRPQPVRMELLNRDGIPIQYFEELFVFAHNNALRHPRYMDFLLKSKLARLVPELSLRVRSEAIIQRLATNRSIELFLVNPRDQEASHLCGLIVLLLENRFLDPCKPLLLDLLDERNRSPQDLTALTLFCAITKPNNSLHEIRDLLMRMPDISKEALGFAMLLLVLVHQGNRKKPHQSEWIKCCQALVHHKPLGDGEQYLQLACSTSAKNPLTFPLIEQVVVVGRCSAISPELRAGLLTQFGLREKRKAVLAIIERWVPGNSVKEAHLILELMELARLMDGDCMKEEAFFSRTLEELLQARFDRLSNPVLELFYRILSNDRITNIPEMVFLENSMAILLALWVEGKSHEGRSLSRFAQSVAPHSFLPTWVRVAPYLAAVVQRMVFPPRRILEDLCLNLGTSPLIGVLKGMINMIERHPSHANEIQRLLPFFASVSIKERIDSLLRGLFIESRFLLKEEHMLSVLRALLPPDTDPEVALNILAIASGLKREGNTALLDWFLRLLLRVYVDNDPIDQACLACLCRAVDPLDSEWDVAAIPEKLGANRFYYGLFVFSVVEGGIKSDNMSRVADYLDRFFDRPFLAGESRDQAYCYPALVRVCKQANSLRAIQALVGNQSIEGPFVGPMILDICTAHTWDMESSVSGIAAILLCEKKQASVVFNLFSALFQGPQPWDFLTQKGGRGLASLLLKPEAGIYKLLCDWFTKPNKILNASICMELFREILSENPTNTAVMEYINGFEAFVAEGLIEAAVATQVRSILLLLVVSRLKDPGALIDRLLVNKSVAIQNSTAIMMAAASRVEDGTKIIQQLFENLEPSVADFIGAIAVATRTDDLPLLEYLVGSIYSPKCRLPYCPGAEAPWLKTTLEWAARDFRSRHPRDPLPAVFKMS